MGVNRDHELHARRRSRNIGVGGVLAAFVLLVFAITVVKLANGNRMEAFDHTIRPSLIVEETE
jgi:hypothetical protein